MQVVPLMDKALSPYVKGGGAKKYEAELKAMCAPTPYTLSIVMI